MTTFTFNKLDLAKRKQVYLLLSADEWERRKQHTYIVTNGIVTVVTDTGQRRRFDYSGGTYSDWQWHCRRMGQLRTGDFEVKWR